ncbi:MMPL family transporter [Micromonospora endolithica]|uniref:MMPL family transporter n=1 Tax=Micromonospora endolithica TaxID=230091 RepID=A0A3A9ZMP7_9ACTN|nr:MMPL family transporter [Micromonospora endolithica]RKN49580.1 MMPL family transporter [Micromonospora endolithica]TWJ23803.1 RND superfamily putative drug exporter [Micromonospora endolithica]
MFERLGRFVVGKAWWVIGGWVLAAVAIILTTPSLGDITSADQESFLPSSYESVQATELGQKAFPQAATATAVIVVERADGQPLTPADEAKVGQLAESLKAENISQTSGYLTGPQAVAPDRSVQIINVGLDAPAPDDPALLDAVRELRADIGPALQGSGLTAGVAGDVASFVDNEDTFNDAFAVVGIATIILIIGLILIIFRSPIAALMPIVVISVVMSVTTGLVAAAGKAFDLSVSQDLQTILLIVLFGIGTDYILFLLFRYRERLRAGDDKRTAMIVSVQRVGEVITSAAGAVIVAFLVLLLASLGFFGSLGPALAIAVGVMLITSLTLIPAVVSLLGRYVFWPSKAWQRTPKATLSRRLGTAIGRRPALVAVASGALLVALAAGVLGYKADYDFSAGFPQDTESARAAQDLQRGFAAGALAPTEVYLTTGDGTPLTDQQVTEFAAAAGGVPGVGQAQPPERGSDPSVARINLLLDENPVSNEAIMLVRDDLRDAVHAAAPPGTRALVGGTTAIFADINSANNRDLSVILPVAAALIALILALLLRSLVAPIYLVIAVLLNFAATLGATVYLFQGVRGEPGVTFQLPIILYLFVVAIGTDYNILMIARLREEAREGNDPHRAAAIGVEHAGPTVAAAGLILAGTFGVLMLAPISFLQQMGFAVAIGIVLSAFVMSMFFVPALTALIGHRAWWPGHGDERPAARTAPEPASVAGGDVRE